MRIGKLTINNFLSYREESIDFSTDGLYVVTGEVKHSKAFGSNGAGKSNLFEAITWCLFGKTIKGLSGNDVINNKVNTNCSVECEIIKGDDKYIIIRGRKDKKIGNQLKVIVNEVDITRNSNSETQLLVNSILSLNYKTFVNSIMFGQGNIERLAKATDSSRKDIFEDILELSKIPKAQAEANTIKRELLNKRFSIYDRFNLIETNIESLSRSLEELNNSRDNFNVDKGKQIIEAIEDIESLDDEICKLEDMVLPHFGDNSLYNVIKAKVDKAKLEYDNANSKLDIHKIDMLNGKLGKLNSVLQQYITKVNNIKSDLVSIDKGKEKTCYVCGSKISSNKFNSIVGELNRKLIKYKEVVKDTKSEITTTKEHLNNILTESKKVEILKNKYLKLDEDLKVYEHGLELREHRLNSLINLYIIRDKAIIKLFSIIRSTFTSSVIIDRLKNDIEMAKLDLQVCEEQLNDLDVEIGYYEFWVDGFSNHGIKSTIIKSVIPYINQRAKVYSDILTDGDITVEFSGYKKMKSGNIKDSLEIKSIRSNGGSNYKSISGGEKRRVDLISALALRDLVASRNNNPLDFMFLDECFEYLDDIGIDRAIDLISELNKLCNVIYIATRNDVLSSMVSGEIHVVNKKGESNIYEK